MGTDEKGNTQLPRHFSYATYDEVISEDFIRNLFDKYCGDDPSDETIRFLQSAIRADVRQYIGTSYPNAKTSNSRVVNQAEEGMRAVRLLSDLVIGDSRIANALRERDNSLSEEFYENLSIFKDLLVSVASHYEMKHDGRPPTVSAAKPHIRRIGSLYDIFKGEQYTKESWEEALVEAENPRDGEAGCDLRRELATNRAKFVAEIFKQVRDHGVRLRAPLARNVTLSEASIRDVLDDKFEPAFEEEEN